MTVRVAVNDPSPLVRAGLERLVDEHPALVRACDLADVVVGATDVVLLDGSDVAGALRSGARGVLPRHAEPADVAEALTLVGAGWTLVAAALVEDLVRRPEPAFPALTPREQDVLARLAHGETNGQIGRALGLATKTVRNHVASICTKLQVLDRAQAMLVAREHLSR